MHVFTHTSVQQELNGTCPSLTITCSEPGAVCLQAAVRVQAESCLRWFRG